MGAVDRESHPERDDAAVVCRSAIRTLLQRSLAHSATDFDDAGVGRKPALRRAIRMMRPRHRSWTEGWNIAKPDLVLPMPKPVAIPANGDVEYTYEIVPTHFSEDKWMQMAEVHPSSPQICASCRGLHSAAGFQVVATRAGRRAVHGFDAQRSAGSAGGAWNHQRLVAGVRAGQFAGPLAGWDGEVRSGGIGPGVPDSLHDERHARAATRPASDWYLQSRRRRSASSRCS